MMMKVMVVVMVVMVAMMVVVIEDISFLTKNNCGKGSTLAINPV